MENNLISDEERRKEKEKMNRLMDSELRPRTVHELRWILLGLSEDIKDHDVYIEGQEISILIREQFLVLILNP